MTRAAQHLAAAFFDDDGRVFLEVMPESVVGCKEEPGLLTLLCQRSRCTAGKRVGVVGPVSDIRRAASPCDVDAGSARHHKRSLFLGCQRHQAEYGAGMRQVDEDVDALPIKPLTRDR